MSIKLKGKEKKHESAEATAARWHLEQMSGKNKSNRCGDSKQRTISGEEQAKQTWKEERDYHEHGKKAREAGAEQMKQKEVRDDIRKSIRGRPYECCMSLHGFWVLIWENLVRKLWEGFEQSSCIVRYGFYEHHFSNLDSFIICLGEDHLGLSTWSDLLSSWISMSKSLPRFGKFSAIVSFDQFFALFSVSSISGVLWCINWFFEWHLIIHVSFLHSLSLVLLLWLDDFKWPVF